VLILLAENSPQPAPPVPDNSMQPEFRNKRTRKDATETP